MQSWNFGKQIDVGTILIQDWVTILLTTITTIQTVRVKNMIAAQQWLLIALGSIVLKQVDIVI